MFKESFKTSFGLIFGFYVGCKACELLEYILPKKDKDKDKEEETEKQ